jgi:hypothetical protein
MVDVIFKKFCMKIFAQFKILQRLFTCIVHIAMTVLRGIANLQTLTVTKISASRGHGEFSLNSPTALTTQLF